MALSKVHLSKMDYCQCAGCKEQNLKVVHLVSRCHPGYGLVVANEAGKELLAAMGGGIPAELEPTVMMVRAVMEME